MLYIFWCASRSPPGLVLSPPVLGLPGGIWAGLLRRCWCCLRLRPVRRCRSADPGGLPGSTRRSQAARFSGAAGGVLYSPADFPGAIRASLLPLHFSGGILIYRLDFSGGYSNNFSGRFFPERNSPSGFSLGRWSEDGPSGLLLAMRLPTARRVFPHRSSSRCRGAGHMILRLGSFFRLPARLRIIGHAAFGVVLVSLAGGICSSGGLRRKSGNGRRN